MRAGNWHRGRCGIVVLLTVLAAVGSAAQTQAATIYVSTSGNDANDGLTWATAKLTVSAGLTTSVSGDQVWVAAGTYVGCITLKAGVALYGGFAGNEDPAAFDLAHRDFAANATILDGNKAGSVVTSPSGATVTTRIDGFTIRNGTGTLSSDYRDGGGIYCASSSPTIANNTITGNTATNVGGGIYCTFSSPTISHNTISGNTALSGGGIYCWFSSPTITNNTIGGNSGGSGGGVYCEFSSSPRIANNTIMGNTASSLGGGICCSLSSAPAIINNTIGRNSSSNGGGVYCSSSPTIANNTITANIATSGGGGIFCSSSSSAISNNIVAFNSSGLYQTGSTRTPTLSHNCVYNPGGSNYTGLSAGTNDISVDPQLLAPAYGKVHLKAGSPCIDAGLDGVVQSGWTDMDGEVRVQNNHVDIGADEFNGATPSFVPKIVRVSSSGNDANDGSNWASARLTVQAGIDAVASTGGGEVWVAAGTYVERITLKQWGHVYGGFAGTEQSRDQRDWIAHVTVLDGNAGGSVVTASALSWGSSTVDGFTIRNGIGTLSDSHRYGGGVYCYYSSPTIANNTITGNTASAGGGGGGGGIYCRSSSPTISNNIITGNTVDLGYGGGVYSYCGSPTISNNTITENTASFGGGIYCENDSSLISNNTITRNTGRQGGGVGSYYRSSATISNNTITENTATTGGGVDCVISSPTVSGNIVAFNSSGVCNSGSSGTPTFSHNCVYGNTAYDYSGLTDPTGTNGNISANPLFLNSGAGDYRLAAFSPCIDAGNNAALPAGMLTDLDGYPRFLDDPDTADTGSGTAPIVDMGAYEFVPVMPGDFNRDGYVDADDVSILRACGTGPSLPYNPSALPDVEPGCTLTPDVNGIIAADFDADGDVDQVDFAALQRCWSGDMAADPACH